MSLITEIAREMVSYDAGDPRRIQHFMKVYAFAKFIGEAEGLGGDIQEILEAAALTHDIGIKRSLKKYGDGSGHYQQLEGPPEAKRLLEGLRCPPEFVERVCYLIAHHHTYRDIQGDDYQILVEADFLVNIHEGGMGPEEISRVREKIFRTAAGLRYLDCLFPPNG